jgi:hypothetical protein
MVLSTTSSYQAEDPPATIRAARADDPNAMMWASITLLIPWLAIVSRMLANQQECGFTSILDAVSNHGIKSLMLTHRLDDDIGIDS